MNLSIRDLKHDYINKSSASRNILLYLNRLISYKFYKYMLAISSALIYATYIVVNRSFLIYDPNPIMFAFGGGLIASLLSTAFLYCSNDDTYIRRLTFRQWKLILTYGTASTLRRTLLFWGLALTSAANAGFLLAGTRPIFALLFGFLFMKEVVQGRYMLIIFGMITGLFLLSTQGTIYFQTGDLLLAGCGAILGFLTAFSRKITTTGISPLALTFFEMTLSTIGLLGIVVTTGRVPIFPVDI